MTTPIPAYLIYEWWYACVETRILTEDGPYAEDQVPEDYTGAELEMKILQRVILTNSAGEILELRMDNLIDVMNADDQTGLGANVNLPGGVSVDIPGANGSVVWKLVKNPAIDPNTDLKARAMWDVIVQDSGVD